MNHVNEVLENLQKKGEYRKIPGINCEDFINLSSNDYLGLAERWKEFIPILKKTFPDAGFSSSASRLLCHNQQTYYALEKLIAELYNKECLLFNSGYHANVGLISALSNLPSTLFICDKLVHASIIDGLKISGATFKRFPHNDYNKALDILRKESTNFETVILVTESIFSMEGSLAPLQQVCSFKDEFKNLLIYVDEAHAFGVRGTKGLGLSEELGILDNIDFIMATFGKAAASVGAFVVCNEDFRNYFINFSRPFIFSTALPPVNVAWSYIMLRAITEMNSERTRLYEISSYIRKKIAPFTNETDSDSQIIPIITGNTEKAVKIARILKDDWQILAMPIRRPTVPPGKECIRLSLNAKLTDNNISKISRSLELVLPEYL